MGRPEVEEAGREASEMKGRSRAARQGVAAAAISFSQLLFFAFR